MVNKTFVKIFSIALGIVVLDQIVKFFIARMDLHKSIPLIDNILHITYIRNTGAGFGLFQNSNLVLVFTSLIIIGVILFYFKNIIKDTKTHIPIGLILGGAVGNLIDRLFRGYVVDFIDFRIWPAFNVADSAISIAALLLIIYFWKK